MGDGSICGFIGCSIVCGPPLVLCWTVASLIVRSLHDRRITWNAVGETLTAGILIAILLVFPACLVAFLAGAAVFVPFLWANATGRLNVPAVVPAIIAGLVAAAIYWWCIFRPIVIEEWKRVTFDDTRRE